MKKNKPEVRFSGFIGDWESLPFSENFDNIRNNTLSRADLNNINGMAKNIHYGDVLIKFGELLDVKREEIPFISDDIISTKLSPNKLQNGDVIIADAAEDASVGKCTELINVEEDVVISGLHTIAIRPKVQFAPKYLGYFMNSSAYHNQLLRLMQGTKVLSISKTAIKDTIIWSPSDKSEQTQIGNFFQNLDQLISLNQKKYDKLVILKKAMLEKMFPKPGAKVPEIRFKGFEGDWEEKKVGEVANLLTGFPFQSKSFTKAGIKLIRGMNVKRGQLDISDPICEYWPSSNGLENYLLKENDIVIQMDGALIGKSYAMISNNDLPALLVQRVTRVRFEYGDFIYQWFQKGFLEYINSIKTETAVPHLSLNDIKDFTISIPSKEEQQKLGNYFQNLDNLISLNHKQLEKLKNIKKACLEKMFV